MKIKSSKIDDIARDAGVSASTVSRVFNNRPYVKEEIRKRVFEVAAPVGIRQREFDFVAEFETALPQCAKAHG